MSSYGGGYSSRGGGGGGHSNGYDRNGSGGGGGYSNGYSSQGYVLFSHHSLRLLTALRCRCFAIKLCWRAFSEIPGNIIAHVLTVFI